MRRTLSKISQGARSVFRGSTCPRFQLSYRHRVRVRARVRVIGLGLGLASHFGICTTTFRTSEPSDN